MDEQWTLRFMRENTKIWWRGFVENRGDIKALIILWHFDNGLIIGWGHHARFLSLFATLEDKILVAAEGEK